MGGTDHTPYDYNLTLSLTRLSGPDNCIVLCAWTNMAAKFVFKIALFLILASIVISFHKLLCTMYQVPQILSPLLNPTMVFFHVKLNYILFWGSLNLHGTGASPFEQSIFLFCFHQRWVKNNSSEEGVKYEVPILRWGGIPQRATTFNLRSQS